jgi:hypothetical protein
MTRSRIITALSLIAAAGTIAACASSDTTAPRATPSASAQFDKNGNNGNNGNNGKGGQNGPSDGDYHDGTVIPGSLGNAGSAAANGVQTRLACDIQQDITGRALIGPQGGQLMVGGTVLIVPPGALTDTVTLSGTIAAGNQFQIDFQPHGLQFKKPAGLVFDFTSCASAPDVVYLDEQGGILERIAAVFSTWWHTIAAPLDHFSTYAVDV